MYLDKGLHVFCMFTCNHKSTVHMHNVFNVHMYNYMYCVC